jgi:hypothetical protein
MEQQKKHHRVTYHDANELMTRLTYVEILSQKKGKEKNKDTFLSDFLDGIFDTKIIHTRR